MWHNNLILHRELKDYRAKEMGFYLDNDKEYALDSRYFTISLLHSNKENSKGVDFNIKGIIAKAVDISNRLNRSFVVPPITCKINESSFCNLCYFEKLRCFHNTMLSTILPFRESVEIYSL